MSDFRDDYTYIKDGEDDEDYPDEDGSLEDDWEE